MDDLIRYEMFYNGQAQEVGIMIGLKDTNIPEGQQECLLYNFNQQLKIPDTSLYKSTGKNKSIKSFFTLKGDGFFKESINRLVNEVNNDGVLEVAKIILLNPIKEDIVYSDNYQCLVKFENITDITSIISEDCTGFYKIKEDLKSIYNYKLEKITNVKNFKGDIIIYLYYLQNSFNYSLDLSNKIVKINS